MLYDPETAQRNIRIIFTCNKPNYSLDVATYLFNSAQVSNPEKDIIEEHSKEAGSG
jgi:hypothetical protein